VGFGIGISIENLKKKFFGEGKGVDRRQKIIFDKRFLICSGKDLKK